MSTERPPVIWARLSDQGRVPGGPVRALDHAAITAAAMALADEEGLDALSMRKIATRMDRSAMALYRHVASKDDLLELMYDAALGELELPAAPSGDWRADLTLLMGRIRRLHQRHAWVGRLGHRPTMGPNTVRLLEYALGCVVDLGLDIDSMRDLVSTALQFTQGFVLGEQGEREAQQRSDLDRRGFQEWMGPFVVGLIADGSHPLLQRMIVDAEDHPDPDATFARRLSMVLDGLAAALPPAPTIAALPTLPTLPPRA